MSATVESTVVQVAFTVDEGLLLGEPELLGILDLLDLGEVARAFDAPDADAVRAGLRRGAQAYHRLITNAAGELRADCHIAGTSLLVCTASDTFLWAREADEELDAEVARTWLGDLGVFLVLLDQVPALGSPAGLVCLGMPSLDTIRAYASGEAPAEAAG